MVASAKIAGIAVTFCGRSTARSSLPQPRSEVVALCSSDIRGAFMTDCKRKPSRRQFLKGAAAASATFTIVPPHVLGGPDHVPPSDTFGAALIGCGGRGKGTFSDMCRGLNVKLLAECDVRFLDKADNKTIFTDFRRVLQGHRPHRHRHAAALARADIDCRRRGGQGT